MEPRMMRDQLPDRLAVLGGEVRRLHGDMGRLQAERARLLADVARRQQVEERQQQLLQLQEREIRRCQVELKGLRVELQQLRTGTLRRLWWRVLGAARNWKYIRIIRRSGLLDPAYYLAQSGDNPRARKNPVRHYVLHGAARGLNPNPLFDTDYYVARHPAAGGRGKNPLVHFIRYGARAGLNPGPDFNSALYLVSHPEVRASGVNPLAHYLSGGMEAGPFTFESPQTALKLLEAPGLARAPRDRVLVVDHRVLTPDQDSGSVRMMAIITLLRQLGFEVTFVADSQERFPVYEERLRRLAPVLLHGPMATLEHLQAEGGTYRFVLLSRPEQASQYLPMVRGLAGNATVIYDTVDLHWVRLTRAAELTGDPDQRLEAERFRKLEVLNATSADVVLAITPEERKALLDEAPEASVVVIPNVHSVAPAAAPLAGREDLFFIGGFEHHPNVDAVEWFVGQILPEVRRELPDAIFHVVGSHPTDEVKRLASAAVRVAGFVEDPTSYFERSRVFVSPLRYGAGMKGKIGQAMSFGLPVVTTSIGAEGMRLVDGETALVADEPEAFAEAVVRLHRDDALWLRLSENGRRHVEANFSETAVLGLLRTLFPVLAGGTAGAAAVPDQEPGR
jgi:hypothetical protein